MNLHQDSAAAERADADPRGMIWDEGHLDFVALGRRRRVTSAGLIAELLAIGEGFVDAEILPARVPRGASLASIADIKELLERRRAPSASRITTDRPLRISWIAPDLIIGGGGYRNIVRCAYQLEQIGHEVSLHLVNTADSDESIQRQIREHFYPLEGFAGRYDMPNMGGDIVLATHWSTMKFADALSDRFGEVMYFVQDFEPAFYAMGSEYLMAEETYRLGHYAITSGQWCEQFLRREYGMEADHFQFPIDKTVYRASPAAKRQNRVLFFAKPEIARRCFELGVQALARFHQLRPDVEIAFYGSEFARDHAVPFPVTHYAVLPTIHDLADLYRTSRVGMVFATTNPSLVPYEMMACGLPVVDLARPGQEANYGGRFDVAKLAPTDPLGMGEALAAFLNDEEDLQRRSLAGQEFASRFPVEEEVGALIESYMAKRVAAWSPDRHRRAQAFA